MIDPAEERRAREFAELSAPEQERLIAEKRANSLCHGTCQCCKQRIEALGKDWPKSCPHCGWDGSKASWQSAWERYIAGRRA